MAIDKAKGIVAKPMPKTWHDRHAIHKSDMSEDDKDLYYKIVANKKPYFMRYIYPALMKQYNTYIKNTNRNAQREFDMTIEEMRALPYQKLTGRQKEFLSYYDRYMPVGLNSCVMNNICRRFEEEFDGSVSRHNSTHNFDYTIMKSDAEYTQRQYRQIYELYIEYNLHLRNYEIFTSYEKIDKIESSITLINMENDFRRECEMAVPNAKVLCNIVLDICYRRSSTKKFAWSMCGETIIQNLLDKNDRIISVPVQDNDGDLLFNGKRFSVKEKKVIDADDDSIE